MKLMVVASLLGRGAQLERLSDGISLLALAYGLAPLLGAALTPSASLLCAALLALGVLHKYWAVRVALDADLFARLGASTDLAADTQALDHALFDLHLKTQPEDARDWSARSQAALALLRRQTLCLGLQALLTLATLLTVPFIG
ncbi:hypothetical protein C4Q28_23055 [Pseudomonas sp. SWI6]|uniref:Uncharacterized protein n=1 Tax=Pseudomonas taiwanensis TaxID=470150 RepID=A0ABR6VB77_9PSED|nr:MULTISPECIES: hypothetical protein [Pseudomonas]AGZ33565.1 hypothetical protein PVLB_03790 [Pseudomonas sp. VLB120]AVD84846.1 hypothetical protein C4Q28_23055 [Pseudomonas sp. SWI6]AVD87073.1 hypothetical protein C4Q26_07890 [Pseudomonas sp. SWI44]MBC3477702.1 hypothetical protein [Pseudomonas taiwanensis]MBC3493006.1 hypothetical protein [Pseudomonas taiwanensis]